MKAFVDTGAFIGLIVRSDQYHLYSKGEYQIYKNKNALFFTNHYVLSELYTRLIYGVGADYCRSAMKTIHNQINQNILNLISVDNLLFNETEKIMLKFAEHKLSFVDASIYVCVQKYGLDEVFTFDSGLVKVGLRTSSLPK